MRIEPGFPEDQRGRVADLFWDAFADKLGRLLAPRDRALTFLTAALRPDHAISAIGTDGQLLGVAGYKTLSGGLISANFASVADVYGTLGALWRGPLLDLLERPLAEGQLLLDGIFVAAEARGQGIGTALLDAAVAEARRRGMSEVRLDVIDRNPRARALYERYGFEAVGSENLGPLSWLFGFRRSTRMRLRLSGT